MPRPQDGVTVEDAYDRSPYPGYAYWFTHPDHLGVLGSLYGVNTARATGSRVLGRGCGDGGNLTLVGRVAPQGTALRIVMSVLLAALDGTRTHAQSVAAFGPRATEQLQRLCALGFLCNEREPGAAPAEPGWGIGSSKGRVSA